MASSDITYKILSQYHYKGLKISIYPIIIILFSIISLYNSFPHSDLQVVT